MSINLKEATEFMLSNGYILGVGKGKYKLTTKFHTEYKAWRPEELKVLPPTGTEIVAGKFYFSWEHRYKQLILEANVPKRLDDNKGGTYQANAYSEAGMKAFRKAIEGGAELGLLKKAIQLYYGSTIRYKQAIGTFMEKGTWKTVYDELAAAIEGGEQTLIDHIKTETKDEHTSYRVG